MVDAVFAPLFRYFEGLAKVGAWLSPTGKVPMLKIQQAGCVEDILFESMVICEYLEETQAGPHLYPDDPLARAKHRAWIEFGSATLGEVWGYLNAKDHATADAKAVGFKDKLARLEEVLGDGPYFTGETFDMVDAVFAPIFRYFDVLAPDIGAPFFEGFAKVSAWRTKLASRASVISAVSGDYSALFQAHLQRQNALLVNKM